MKTSIGIAIALVASTALAAAAGAPPTPAFEWSGTYIGLNAGYAFSGNEANVESIGPDPFPQDNVLNNIGNDFDLDSDGFIGGFQIGYNWQLDAIMFGVEADAQYADVKGTDTIALGGTGFKGSQELDFLATLRARLGLAVADGILIYGTGGLAVGDVNLDAHLTNDAFAGGDEWIGSESPTEWGWTAGAGAEVMVTDGISLKAEYLYVDLGSESFTAAGTNDPTSEIVEFDFENQFHVIRAGLNWHFGS